LTALLEDNFQVFSSGTRGLGSKLIEPGPSKSEAVGEPRDEQLYAWYLNLVAADNHVPGTADVDRLSEGSYKCTVFEIGLGHQVAGQRDAVYRARPLVSPRVDGSRGASGHYRKGRLNGWIRRLAFFKLMLGSRAAGDRAASNRFVKTIRF